MGFLPARARRKLFLVGSSEHSNQGIFAQGFFDDPYNVADSTGVKFFRAFEFHVFHIDIINFDNFRAFTSIGFFCSMLFSFCSVFCHF